MHLTDKTKIVLLGFIILLAIFSLAYVRKNDCDDDSIPNMGALIQNIEESNSNDEILLDNSTDNDKTVDQPQSNAQLAKKMKSRNSSKDGSYHQSNYTDGKRGGKADLDKFFEDGNPLETNEGFDKSDPDNNYAGYVAGKKQKLRDVDKFNADSLLPQENNKDWFDDPYQSANVKNSHLINIYRPIGVNTIQTTLKNPSWDIRGTPNCPKVGSISPWMNSSIEPDTNLRPQSLCY